MTSAVDALLAAHEALAVDEQEELFKRIGEARLRRLTSSEHELAAYLRSIEHAAQHAGCEPADLTVTQYREAVRGGVDLEPLGQLLNRLGSWRQAKEAFDLAQTSSLRAVDARLAKRQVKGKIWRYSTETLKAFFAEAVKHYGDRIPLASELDAYRERQLELARAKGEDGLHFPQAGAYRRRWGTYENACLAMGYTPDQVAERLERGSVAELAANEVAHG